MALWEKTLRIRLLTQANKPQVHSLPESSHSPEIVLTSLDRLSSHDFSIHSPNPPHESLLIARLFLIKLAFGIDVLVSLGPIIKACAVTLGFPEWMLPVVLYE